MRASRLLTILMTLQVRGRVTARALADECEVTVRTIYRDIEALSAAGVPVYAERGPEGGYQLLDGYRTRLNGLSSQEAEALFLGVLQGPAAELGLGAVLTAAQLKVLTALPPDLRDSAERLRMRFHLDAPGWFEAPEPTPHLPALAEAIWTQRRVRMDYRSWRGEGVRLLEPLGVVLKGGRWYLAAAGEGRVRTYRVSRIRELLPTGEAFERPADFDLAAYWQASSARYEASLFQGRAVVRVSPAGFELAGWLYGEQVARAAGDPDAAGWRQLALPIETLEQAARSVLRLGGEAEVIAPAELRDRVANSALAMARIYSNASAPGAIFP
jgi:predicted DNA-binding transcriptional regulator YafY